MFHEPIPGNQKERTLTFLARREEFRARAPAFFLSLYFVDKYISRLFDVDKGGGLLANYPTSYNMHLLEKGGVASILAKLRHSLCALKRWIITFMVVGCCSLIRFYRKRKRVCPTSKNGNYANATFSVSRDKKSALTYFHT